MKRILWTISSVLAALGIAAALLISLNLRGEEPLPATETLQSTPALVQRGEYLARVGNCMACHTTPGGSPFAGGRGIETPFGVVHSSNLTPDRVQGRRSSVPWPFSERLRTTQVEPARRTLRPVMSRRAL